MSAAVGGVVWSGNGGFGGAVRSGKYSNEEGLLLVVLGVWCC